MRLKGELDPGDVLEANDIRSTAPFFMGELNKAIKKLKAKEEALRFKLS